MAGRPRTMAKRVLEIEKRAEEVWEAFEEVMPERYLEDPPANDPLHAAWNSVWCALSQTFAAFHRLTEMLRERADFTRIEWLRMQGYEIAQDGQGEDAIGEADRQRGAE